ncbi:HpcH/HpaI aldolase/citrate lyase family protein [Sphingorhabdus sp. SMR4y]|uniref:HpcH/HpaI aldolase/citrate lyase family protein n=1 Tax=Sphingorhabdus sp. SMR4y TaxID=2584094 RepID=UPI000B5C811F|nr:CoA ester lyase [Sphingorhabdus sp. SMR4y]ASK88873.1 L-malyl-CoA/beta-methylmalyl-CoA lyase [Sphingorhabdus sp. SMR4y]
MTTFTNFLFVPANRPERYAKAAASGADLICIDLEDSVPADEKDTARQSVLTALATLEREKTAVRINGLNTADGLADLLALRNADHSPSLVFVPMVESAGEIEIAHSIVGDKVDGLIPLIETVKGLRAGDAIAASKGVTAMMFGGGDFSAELGTRLEWEPLLAARGAFIMCCASAQIAAIDVPYIDMSNEDGLAEECARAKAMGFHAKAAIHPKQLAAIQTAMRPSDAEIAEASEALAAYEKAGGKAISHNGRMLEAPVMQRYRRIVESA